MTIAHHATVPAASPAALSADAWLRRSRQMLCLGLLLCCASAWVLHARFGLWSSILEQDRAAMLWAATAFGLALSALPLAAIFCTAWGLFARVESLVRPRTLPQQKHELVLVCFALVCSLLPAMWPLSKAARALYEGSIRIRHPIEHHFSLHSDPLAFAENLAYWVMGGVALALLAGVYWRSRWRLYQALRQHPAQG